MKILEFFETTEVKQVKVEGGLIEWNFLGSGFFEKYDAIRDERDYWSGRCRVHSKDNRGPYPYHEDYFEYEDLLIALMICKDSPSMIEVGAGYGRWITNFVSACRRLRGGVGKAPRVMAVEADPGHVKGFQDTCKINDFDAVLIKAALMPDAHNGAHTTLVTHRSSSSRFGGVVVNPVLQARSGRNDDSTADWARLRQVQAVNLKTLVDAFNAPIGFINFDIQNAEVEIIPEAVSTLAKTSNVVHVSTHSALADKVCKKSFYGSDFMLLREFAWRSTHVRDGITFMFVDGIQTYLNKALLSAKQLSFAERMCTRLT